MNVRLSALTNVGMVRDHNEDDFTVIQSVSPFKAWDYQPEGFDTPDNGILLMVAYGMGGANAGEIASSIVVSVVENAFKDSEELPDTDKSKEDFLKKTIVKSKKEIVKQAKNNIEYQGMGTTVVMAWVVNNKCYLAWAGDSRAYLMGKERDIEIVTKDHSLVWELMEKGMLTEEEAETHPDSNIITQSLSDSGSKLKPDSKVIDINEGDKLLLCSDGLNGMVHKKVISDILSQNQGEEACSKLVAEANANGGTDNITVVLMETAPYWKRDAEEINNDEEDYEPITEKTIKVKITDDADGDKTEERPEPEKSEDDPKEQKQQEVVQEEKSKPGFLKKFWDKIVNPQMEDDAIPDNSDVEKTKEDAVDEEAESSNTNDEEKTPNHN
ncbi:MAG: hypothetical protein C0598_04290 [Marinilabiliales bacterium]|nr:MAG: hypothetical protein C0598_04290 [Marinilabiliales bacterium]